LATADIPSHTHTGAVNGTVTSLSTTQFGVSAAAPSSTNTGATGGGGGHSHGFTTSIKYYDFIIASKN
jgi:hypothetical protein